MCKDMATAVDKPIIFFCNCRLSFFSRCVFSPVIIMVGGEHGETDGRICNNLPI